MAKRPKVGKSELETLKEKYDKAKEIYSKAYEAAKADPKNRDLRDAAHETHSIYKNAGKAYDQAKRAQH